jgi:hypothetical protein
MIIKERCSSFGFETINILATVSIPIWEVLIIMTAW